MTHVTREELLTLLDERAGRDYTKLPTIGWVLDELEEMRLLVFDAPPMREPVELGTVVSASTRTSPNREYWTRFTNRERVHSTQCWINERGIPASWADLVNPRPTRREP
jgi:hypothetical protein